MQEIGLNLETSSITLETLSNQGILRLNLLYPTKYKLLLLDILKDKLNSTNCCLGKDLFRQ